VKIVSMATNEQNQETVQVWPWNRTLNGLAYAELALASVLILVSIIALSVASHNSDKVGPTIPGIVGVVCGCLGSISGGVGVLAFRSNMIQKLNGVAAVSLASAAILVDFILFVITSISLSHNSSMLANIPNNVHNDWQKRKAEVGLVGDTLRLMLALESIILVIGSIHMLCCAITTYYACEKWRTTELEVSSSTGCKLVFNLDGRAASIRSQTIGGDPRISVIEGSQSAPARRHV